MGVRRRGRANRSRRIARAALLGALTAASGLLSLARADVTQGPDALFREANDLARAGDYPRATANYAEIAARGQDSASLYWNWAQASRARGATGEALWALLRALELEPGDDAVDRAIEEVRAELHLDRAELQPDPRAVAARLARRFGLEWAAAVFAVASLVAHAAARFSRSPRARSLAFVAAVLAVVLALAPVLGSSARPLAVVVRRGAPLLPSASPTAVAASTLREGEVVPILDRSGHYVRLEDSSGARGWALAEDVRPLHGAIH
jgi:tetratricopeptide (TPR) repeat protein